MTYQEQSNAYTAFKAQSGLGAQATGAGAAELRTTGGSGGQMTKAAVESKETRRDGMSKRGRHGSQKTSGSSPGELSLESFDEIIEAVMRGTWGTADLAITNATAEMSSASLSVGANSIVASAGSWISSGLRVGDVIRASAGLDATNMSRNIRITALTATTITTAETLTVEAGPIAAWTIDRPGRVLINPASGALVKRYFTIEEHEIDIDGSEVFTDCVWGSIKLTMSPDGIITIETTWTGTGQMEPKTGVDAPHFTSPTLTTTEVLSVTDATVRFGASDLVDLSAFEITIAIDLTPPPVIANVSPDVMAGSVMVSGSITTLRQDLLDVTDFINETQLSLHVLAAEPDAAPEDFISLFVPNFTLGGVDKSALSKSGGARTQKLDIPKELVGVDERGGAYDSTMIKFQRSNA